MAGAASDEYEDAMNEDLDAAEALIAGQVGDVHKKTSTVTKEGVDVTHNDKGLVKSGPNKDTDNEGVDDVKDSTDINDVDSQAATGTISQAALPSSFGGSQRHSQTSLQSLALTLDEDTVVTTEIGSGGGVQEAHSKQGLGRNTTNPTASSDHGGGYDGELGEGEDLDSLAATGSTSRGGGFSEATSEGGGGGVKGVVTGSSSSSSSVDKLSQGSFGVIPPINSSSTPAKAVSSTSNHPIASNDKSTSSSSSGPKASSSSLSPQTADNTADRLLDVSGSGSGSGLDKDDSGFGLESVQGPEPSKTEGNSSSSTVTAAAAVPSATTTTTSNHPLTHTSATSKGGGAPSSSKVPKATTIQGTNSTQLNSTEPTLSSHIHQLISTHIDHTNTSPHIHQHI